ncbi:hypothetical protein J7J84_03435 [bacterium]|nr:hypothetical protein [bacterium]
MTDKEFKSICVFLGCLEAAKFALESEKDGFEKKASKSGASLDERRVTLAHIYTDELLKCATTCYHQLSKNAHEPSNQWLDYLRIGDFRGG